MRSKSPTIPTAGPASPITDRPSPRVLIAEDNDINRALASEILEFLGFAVHVATNGKEALQAVLRDSFELILMDCQMPILDGIETTRHIRTLEDKSGLNKTPIVALSGNNALEGRATCLAAGMDDYLSKPFTISELQHIVEKWVPSMRR